MRYIQELTEGERFSQVYLCKNKITATTKSGKNYYSLNLQDKTGQIDGKIWDLSSGIDHFETGDFIQVEIEDNGRGIATKDLPYIFDRFYRTDSSRNSSKGGSGIGLSIVKKIIEDHGGRIWATSKEGIGTEMHFVLRKYQEVIQNEQQNSDH